MLQKNLELIVQYPERRGYKCRGFRGLHLRAPVYIVFDGAGVADQRDANLLGTAFCAELLHYPGSQEELRPPCFGSIREVRCHALNEPTCQKVLVRTAGSCGPRRIPRLIVASKGGGAWPNPTAEALWLQHWGAPNWQVVPIMPAGTTPSSYLPVEWQEINASFWTRDPTESLWSVFQRAGLAPEESRIFISYVRRDTTAIADQLFAALTEEGFDVFLDRSSVPVGVQFQERLMQDLVDKAMVVFLNSPGVSQSKWVGEEIATIKKYRLGLLELHFPGAQERKDIDADYRMSVDKNDLTSAGPHYAGAAPKLRKRVLRDVVERIKTTHGQALHRRRFELIDNFAAALQKAGKTAQVLSDGTFILPAQRSRASVVVGLTTRIPELADFCSLHQRGGVSPTRMGWLITPSPFFIAQRQAQVTWLGGVCNIQHVNEGQISALAAAL